MKVAVALLLLVVGAAVAELSFDQFLAKYNKSYSGAEYARRKAIYDGKVEDVESHRAEHGSKSWKGVNQFSDMTHEEFLASGRVMKQKIDLDAFARSCLANGVGNSAMIPDVTPASVDWRTVKPAVVSPVQDQGGCGSCWAFSTTAVIESAWAIKHGNLVKLSEQEIVDCSHACTKVKGQEVCNQGCGGGFMWTAMHDIINWGGQATEAAYNYTGEDGKCRQKTAKPVDKIVNYTCLSGPKLADEKMMAAFVAANGPLSIAMDASPLASYTSGILIPGPNDCSKKHLNHAINIVGYGTENSTDYWIVRNSWNKSWGEDGYFRIIRGKGACGLNSAVIFPIVAA